jgi:subtilisin family serine protease
VLPLISALDNVWQVKSVQTVIDEKLVIKQTVTEKSLSESISTIYGPSYAQIAIHNGHLLHEIGLRGNGIKVGVFDSGFSGVNYLGAFSKLRDEERLKFQYDIVDDDNSVLNGGNHGKSVLSIMTAFMPDSIIGSAPEADYYLFRTEDGSSEHVTEEDNWVRAAEMADSIGIQVVNSSLGYTTFELEENNHSYEDMDGNTTRISQAADIAASKGMLIVNSAGNSGDDSWYYIGAPADADSILAVGAVTDKGKYAWFSSRGPSFDGDVKPNVCGVGYQTVYADLTEGIKRGNGTSFSSPIIAGLAACLWQAFPDKSNMEIIRAIESSSHLINAPNDSLGYGIPDFFRAYESLSANKTFSNSGILIYPNPFYECLNILVGNSEVNGLKLYDTSAKLVYETSWLVMGDNAAALALSDELSHLSPGTYYLNFLNDSSVLKSDKIIKLPN